VKHAARELFQLRSLQWVSLAATLWLCWHAEVYVGKYIGLGDSAWALPIAVDAYVVLALAVGRQVPAALLTLSVSAGGGDFLIGWESAPDDERLLRGSVAAVVGVLLVAVLWQCERLATIDRDERHALAAAEVRHAAELDELARAVETATGEAQRASAESLAQQETHTTELARLRGEMAVEREARERVDAELDELQRILDAGGRSDGSGGSATKTRKGAESPDLQPGDHAHLPAAKAAAARLAERREAVTRDALVTEMRAAGAGVGSARAGRLLAVVEVS
jgi:hypothetical protein